MFLELTLLAFSLGVHLAQRWANRGLWKDPVSRDHRSEPAQDTVGTPIPYVYGTCMVDAPVLLWVGKQRSYEDPTYGPERQADMIFSLGTPAWDTADPPNYTWRAISPIRLLSVRIGNKLQPLATPIGHGEMSTPEIDLGGRFKGGRFIADLWLHDGRATQDLADNVKIGLMFDQHGEDFDLLEGYRNQITVTTIMSPLASTTYFNSGGSLGQATDVKAIGFEVESLGPQPIGQDANPAWVIYDLIASPVWKMGIDPDLIDLASFQAAATTLEEEEHGYSNVIYRPEHAPKIIAGILDQIDGVLFEDPSTGTIKLVLIRAVDEEGLLEANKSNTIGRPNLKYSGWSDTATQVNVSFTNREREYLTDATTAGRLANSLGGRRKVEDAHYPGVTSMELAARIAARNLAVAGRPLIGGTVTLNREFFAYKPGDAFNGNWPEIGITNKVFRIMQVDLGQRAAGGIVATVVEDVFDQATTGALTIGEVALPFLLPIHERLLTEAPYWIMQKMLDYGVITSADVQRLYAVAVHPDDTVATTYEVKTRNDTLGETGFSSDVPGGDRFTQYATVSTEYPRTAEPYDTTTGLVISDPTTGLTAILDALTAPTETQVRQGLRLAILMHEDGAHEFIAFEGVTGASGGPYTLTNVWRGLMDTPPITHAVGTRFVWLGDRYATPAGVRGWAEGTEITAQWVPRGSILTGTNDDTEDAVTIAGRAANPLPVANLVVYGNDLEGTEGIPATTGRLKAVSLFDGDGYIEATQRDRLSSTLERGDDIASVVESGTTWDVIAERQNLNEDPDGEVTLDDGLTTTGLSRFTLGTVGVGTIDVKMRSQRAGRSSTYDPTVRVTAPHWRNLLANTRFYDPALAELSTSGWTNSVGTVAAAQGTDSLERTATGTLLYAATASAGVTTCYQNVQLSGFPVSRMAARLHFYYRNLSADADDTVTVSIQPIDANGDLLGSATSSGALTGSATLWARSSLTIAAVTAGATGIRVTLTMTAVGGGDTTPSAAFAGLRLNVGQISDQLLDNPTFDDVLETLTYAISGSPDPAGTSTTTTWTVTPTVGGAGQTSLSVTIRLIYPGTKGAAPTDTLSGWSNTGGWTSISGSTWEATFTRASASVGTPTFSFTATSGSTTGTLTADITAGSSAEVPAPTLTDDTVAVASLAITAVWDDADNSIVEDVATTFTITHTPTNFTPNVPTMTVTISTGSTTTSPTTSSNPDSWTIGAWSNPGGGTQWSTTISKAGAAPSGASSVQFSTTPSTAGSLGLACSGSNSQSIAASSGTDTLTVTAAATWTTDATSGKGVPADNTEWGALLTAASTSGTLRHLWGCQNASGDITDAMSPAADFGYFGGTITYQNTITGWTRKGIRFTATDSAFRNLDADLPTPNATSFMYVLLFKKNSTPGTNRSILAIGLDASSGNYINLSLGSANLLSLRDGASSIGSGLSAVGTNVMPIIVRHDRTNNVQAVYTEDEKIVATFNATDANEIAFLGNSSLNSPDMDLLYVAMITGSAAEAGHATAKAILQQLGWSPGWTP